MSEKSIKNQKRSRAKKRKNSRRKKRVAVIIIELLILCILGTVAYGMFKFGKFQRVSFGSGDIQVNDGMEKEGYTTIALYGGDSREEKLEAGTHTDCIIVASIDNKTKEVRMASIYRDTFAEMSDGKMAKINYAYFSGGPQEGINVLNKNLDLAIENYVTVNFKALADAIDLLGGVEIDVKEEEIQYFYEFIDETGEFVGSDVHYVTEPGVQKLDGVQAVTYARIRSTEGGDLTRTERQRTVLEKMFEKAKGSSLKTLNDIVDKVFPQVSTSFSLSEIVALASSATKYQLKDTSGFPYDLDYKDVQEVGSVVVSVGLTENVKQLHDFLYPNETYEPSETVKNISQEIENITGVVRSQYHLDSDTQEEQTEEQPEE